MQECNQWCQFDWNGITSATTCSMQMKTKVVNTKATPRSGRWRSKSRVTPAGSRSCTPPQHVAPHQEVHTAGKFGSGAISGTHATSTGRGIDIRAGKLQGGKGLVKATMDAGTRNNALEMEVSHMEDNFGRSTSPDSRATSRKGLPVAGPGAVAVRSWKAGTLLPPHHKSFDSWAPPPTPESMEFDANLHFGGGMRSLASSMQSMGGQQENQNDEPFVPKRKCIKSHR